MFPYAALSLVDGYTHTRQSTVRGRLACVCLHALFVLGNCTIFGQTTTMDAMSDAIFKLDAFHNATGDTTTGVCRI